MDEWMEGAMQGSDLLEFFFFFTLNAHVGELMLRWLDIKFLTFNYSATIRVGS